MTIPVAGQLVTAYAIGIGAGLGGVVIAAGRGYRELPLLNTGCVALAAGARLVPGTAWAAPRRLRYRMKSPAWR